MCSDYVNCSDPEIIDWYLKGKSAKANPMLKNHPDAIRIILYYDTLEVCNPLGSASAQHKLGVVYCTYCWRILVLVIGPVSNSLVLISLCISIC